LRATPIASYRTVAHSRRCSQAPDRVRTVLG